MDEFLQSIDHLKNPLAGTENTAWFLFSMIKMLKPQRVLEIGIGYTTPFIVQAIKQNTQEYNDIASEINSGNVDFSRLKNIEINYYLTPKTYTYTGIDTMEQEHCTRVKEWLASQSNTELIEENYKTALDKQADKYNFIWIDAGDYNDYYNILENYTHIFADNAFIVLHNTNRMQLPNFPSSLKLVEENKADQNSLTVLRYVKNN
jgi:predicted O-methyltransferase YrrM